jgi:hypothetical protein
MEFGGGLASLPNLASKDFLAVTTEPFAFWRWEYEVFASSEVRRCFLLFSWSQFLCLRAARDWSMKAARFAAVVGPMGISVRVVSRGSDLGEKSSLAHRRGRGSDLT